MVASSFAPYTAAASEQLLKRCVELSSDTVDYYRARLGDLYFDIQQYPAALDNYRRALLIREQYRPDRRLHQDVLLLQLAKCYRHLGRNDEAISYALQAAGFNQRNEEAKAFFYSLWTKGKASRRDSTKSSR